MPEKTIGEFELFTDKLIGKGAWGEVFHGRQKSLNRPVAVKILKKELTADPDFVKRFRREAETLAKMVDEHIIQVYSAGEHEGSYYFIMEYVQGQPLDKFVARGRKFTANEIAYIAESVARALKAAWESTAKIVHRDIKPSNIMVSYTSSLIAPPAQAGAAEKTIVEPDINILEAKIKVMDFGLAKLTEGDKDATMVGTVIGTPKYISPEQGMGNPADTRSDIYSLGIVMYELATGRIPFESESAMSMIRHHIYDTAMLPSEHNPEIPKDLESIIMKCIHKDPNMRYASPNELLEDLAAFKRQQPPTHASSSAIEATMISDVARRKKTRLALYGGIVGLLILGGFASYMFMFKPDKTTSESFTTTPPGGKTAPLPAPVGDTTSEPAIDEELKELLDQIETKISEEQLEEAWTLMKEALAQAPDVDQVKSLQQKLQRVIDLRACGALAEAFIQENLAKFSDSPLLTMEQKKFNYVLSLLGRKRYNDVREEVANLIDLDDEIISAAALYFQMRIFALEKKPDHLNEMEKLASKMETFYGSSPCVALATSLIDKTRAGLLEQAWQSCLDAIGDISDLNGRIKTLERFIQVNPENPHLADARQAISKLKDQIKDNIQKQYESLISLSQKYKDQGLYTEAIQQVIEARQLSTNKTQVVEVTKLRDEIELAFLDAKGIIPLKGNRDASYCHKFIKSKKDDVEMMLIPANTFTMGTDSGASNERPAHEVTLTEYYIDKYEVTNEQFDKFVQETGHKTEAEKAGKGWVWVDGELIEVKGAGWRDPAGDGAGIQARAKHPVVQVSWNDARAYAQWADKRLPTEAEWERAARGNKAVSYPWGNQWRSSYCNNIITGPSATEPVTNYESGQSPAGCYDMSGNVAEWCSDWYAEKYYQQSVRMDNPPGPSSGQSHALRGGSWVVGKKWLQTTTRVPGQIENQTSVWSNYIGFRCVKDVNKELLPYLEKIKDANVTEK